MCAHPAIKSTLSQDMPHEKTNQNVTYGNFHTFKLSKTNENVQRILPIPPYLELDRVPLPHLNKRLVMVNIDPTLNTNEQRPQSPSTCSTESHYNHCQQKGTSATLNIMVKKHHCNEMYCDQRKQNFVSESRT